MGDNGVDNRRLFEHFIVAGLAEGADELTPVIHECGNKPPEQVPPIIDITVIFPSLGETVPKGYECVETTPSGHPADLNHGSFRTNSAFLCYRRGYNKAALVDIGILDESKNEKVKFDSTIIQHTHFGHSANVNNSSAGLYFTTRRSKEKAPPHQLVITHICVILTTKGEVPPHTYFKIDKNLNKGMVGSGVYICYKKAQSSSKRISYKPFILDCYPKVEDMTNSIAQNVSMFCLPMGAVIESWAKDCCEPDKMFSTCVLTDECGNKFYGASLTFYEKYSKELTDTQLEKLELSSMDVDEEEGDDQGSVSTEAKYYSSKAICIVSRYPFFESFRKFLFFVNGMSQSGPHKLPIERYISHLMMEVPFPSPSRPRVLVQLNNELVAFESHDDSQIPLSGATFVESLKFLGVDNILYAMLLSLLEQKILVHSLRPWLLTAVSETLCAMMFPFHWQCPYIPQCPLDLAGVLHAPLPFIAGVHSRYFDLYEDPPEDVTCFDLDTTTISNSLVRRNLKLNVLPKKPLKKLRQGLEKLYLVVQNDEKKLRGDSDYKKKLDLNIREEFLRFMCQLMFDYTYHLKPITSSPTTVNATDMNVLFDLSNFLKSRDKNSQEFYRRLSETQCFIRFIEERSFLSDKNAYNVFFDDCLEKLQRDGCPETLLDYDSYLANHTVVVPPPEMLGNLKEKSYDYSGFPSEFDEKLFETDEILRRKAFNVPKTSLVPASVDLETQPYAFVRSKQEIRIASTELTYLVDQSEMLWPRSLLFYAYSLWFLQMPALVSVSRNKLKMLLLAFRILSRMEKSGVIFYDQVPYRTLIRLCGEYKYPALAFDLLKKMKRHGIKLNAITYGTYHWAVMQGEWPSQAKSNAHEAWRRLRIRLEVLSAFCSLVRNGLISPTQNDERDEMTSITSSHSRNELNVGSGISLSNQSLSSSVNIMDSDKLSTRNSISINENIEPMKSPLDEDPLGAFSNGNVAKDISKEPMTETLSPSRNQFIKEHSASPFSKELDDLDKKMSQERKKAFKLGGSWLKGLATSPIINKLMKSSGSDITEKQKTNSMGACEKVESTDNSLNMSPSLHSLVNQFRKQAIKSYDGVVQQSSVILKKSMFNSLISDSKNRRLNRGTHSTVSSSEENLDMFDPYSREGIYQLDSGTSGDILSLEYWMKDALPQNITSLNQLCSNMQEDPFDIVMSTASKCPTCENIIYDEELMSGWKLGSVNMNSTCPLCQTSFSPSLHIAVNKRPLDKLASSWYIPFIFNFLGNEKDEIRLNHELEDGLRISIPFLSPLVLRKEMEMLLGSDILAFSRRSLRVSHPVIFWNFLYYCRRLDLPSHIYAWISPQVHIRCVYDIPSLHTEQLAPMYFSRDDRPEMKDSLLARPPFKFIHDIVKEVIESTGYLSDVFTPDELDYSKASASKDSKINFLKKLKTNVDVDGSGSLKSVSPAKIIAGKENPEMANLLLRTLAINAGTLKPTRPTKVVRSKPGGRDKSKEKKGKSEEKGEKKTKKERDREVEREKRRLSKASIILSEMNEKESKLKSRSKSKERKSRESKVTKSSDRRTDNQLRESTPIRDDSTPRRESSGGTSKGEDSGIAEESELHDTARQSRRVSASFTGDMNFVEQSSPSNEAIHEPTPPSPPSVDDPLPERRPTTASGRPQTSMGRPGTAAARPAPPKVKKTKVADIDPVTVNQQPMAFEKSTVIIEDELKLEEEQFLVDEEETNELISRTNGANINDLSTSQEHGALINKIIENTLELEKDLDIEDMEFDLHEHKKMRAEVEDVQKSLQNSAQTVQPLTKTLEFISEDMTSLLKEVEGNRNMGVEAKREAVELKSRKREGIGSYLAQLVNMDDELNDVRAQISKLMAQILENEKRINELMINN